MKVKKLDQIKGMRSKHKNENNVKLDQRTE